MPHSKSLGDGLHQLRFVAENVARRITYVLDPKHQAVTLMTFHKRRMNERAEFLRARRALSAHEGARTAGKHDATKKDREKTMATNTIPWEKVRDDSLSAMTTGEREEYDAAATEAEARLELAELVYNVRNAAGLPQTELARRAGTRQSVISAIENGAQATGGVMLSRIACALGGSLRIAA